MSVVDKKDQRVEMRLPAEAKKRVDYAAQFQSFRLWFIVAAAVEQATRVIEQQKIVDQWGDCCRYSQPCTATME